MKTYALRLHPGQDLKMEVDAFAQRQALQAGIVLTCVGSLTRVSLRLANQPEATILEGHFEIVSLVGTFSTDGSHLHLSVSDSNGRTLGGHLLDGSRIYTTAEIALAELEGLRCTRPVDPDTGYDELAIESL